MRTVILTPETLIFYKIYGVPIKPKNLYLRAIGGKVVLYNPGIIIDPSGEAAITDELDYMLTDSEGNIIMGIDTDSGWEWFTLLSVSGTVLQAPVLSEQVPYYIQSDGTITKEVTAYHVADGRPDGSWRVSSGSEPYFEGRLPVSSEGILSEVPFTAVVTGGIITPWNSTMLTGPTHIVWDVYEQEEDAAAVSITAGNIFGPVPDRGAVAEIEFIGKEVGMYAGLARSESVYAEEGYSDLIGYVVPSKLTPRLDSASIYRYGSYILLSDRVPETDVYYYTDTDPELKLYEGTAILNENASTIYFITEGEVFFTYRVRLDPLPYWNTDMDLPVKITDAEGILLPEDIDWLLHPYIVFSKTGDLEYHALLSLHELGVSYGLITEQLPVKTWRAQSKGVLADKEYFIKDLEDKRIYSETLPEDRVRYIVALLCAKLGWTEV